MSFGISRICHSPTTYAECTLSVLSVKKYNPSVSQTQFIGPECKSDNYFKNGTLESAVNIVKKINHKEGWIMKAFSFLHSPYESTLQLDCDTVVMSSTFVPNYWSLLSKADVVWNNDWDSRLKVPFPQPCSAIMAWKRNDEVSKMFQNVYHILQHPAPFPVFRWGDQEAIWYYIAHKNHTLRITYVEDEYQCPKKLPTKNVYATYGKCLIVHYHPNRLNSWNCDFFSTHLDYALPYRVKCKIKPNL